MKSRFALLCALTACVLLARSAWGADENLPSTLKPVPRDGDQMKRHERFNERVKQGNVDLIFIGDSITQGWEGAGKDVWAKHYAKRNAVNLGIGGDRTQHVLWRLDHGNIDGIAPKLAVLMIGTNNSNGSDNTAEEIAAGITAIVEKLRAKLPQTKVLVLAIFPRGPKPNPQREKNAKASEIAAKLADGKMVLFLDIGNKFLEADGSLPKEIMPDYLHLTPRGYEIWAEAIEPQVAELMGEK
jgi:beta-glucosidase